MSHQEKKENFKKHGIADLNMLFKSYSRAMYNICLRMLGNKQDAEDILQEAFIKAYKKKKQLNDMESFGAWLKRIVVNDCIRFQRKRVYWLDIEGIDETKTEQDAYNWLSSIPIEKINDAIIQLPEGCRLVFNLYLIENYTHKEVAEKLQIAESTSKSQYIRAKNLLKKRLKNIDNEKV